jgi:transcriptional regulator GlxA family with amidase domain
MIVSADGRRFDCAVGVPIAPGFGIAQVPACDVVVVTDIALGPREDPRGRWAECSSWLREQYRRGAAVCSVCTGSIVLAEAGLLTGLEATTHWSMVDTFQQYYPDVRLRPERILCPAGHEGRIITAGGASSWEDLALYLVARHFGEAEAVRIAKLFLFGDRSEGQLPYATLKRHRRVEDGVVADCQAWLAENYASPNPVRRLVDRTGLSERTLSRRFKAATGFAPLAYVHLLRVEEAKQMLEATRLSVDAIGEAAGYADPVFFRRLFKRRTGVTPARYRARFQGLRHRCP